VPSMVSATSSCADSGAAERRLAQTMLATVAHELRTPLTSIRGYIETLLDEELDPATARRFLETARREALRVSRLVDGMLEFSLLDLTSGDLPAGCDTAEQIRATLEMLSPLAASRHITIRTSLLADAKARVAADSFVHAFSNLVENAIKYVGEGGTIEIISLRSAPFVEIAVHDDGVGVAPERCESIFLLGVRGDALVPSGRGIGLALVRAIAERAGGSVRVERSPLGGAAFLLRFLEG
ncbi:MAG TPA: HAMP domain-containing sensor histidine kinase, partial [Candidatus Nitrosotalea sp.]|nr:HAMP domain-containing sensor histidine kinase [Candidatus Nitrosotalea sp.]